MISIEILFVFILLGLSAFFSGSETAFFSLSKTQLQKISEERSKYSNLIKELIENPKVLLVSLLFGNTLVNVAASVIVTDLLIKLSRELQLSPISGVILTIIIMPLILLIFGEVTPKTFALKKAETWTKVSAPLLSTIIKIFWPIISILRKFTTLLSRDTLKPHPMPFITEEEIKTLFRVSSEEGHFEKEERELIDHILEFGETVVKEVMIPRTDMICISKEAGLEEIIQIIKEHGHSRIPVYHDNVDNIVGVLHAKDLLRIVGENLELNLEMLMRKAYFVPENKSISELLKELKTRKSHIAIVVDEYGGTSGLVTMEDILEEIIGEIYDEYDVEEELFEVKGENIVIVDGKMDIDEFNEKFNTKIPTEDYETIGGFILDLFGRIPKQGQSKEYHEVRFIIEKVIKHRIKQIKVVFLEKKIHSSDSSSNS